MTTFLRMQLSRVVSSVLFTLLFSLLVFSGIANASVTVTRATGGGAIASNTAPACSAAGTWTALTGPAIAEGNSGDIGTGDIVLSAPTGFEFNTAATVTILLTGSGSSWKNINNVANGTSMSVTSITATAITFNVTAFSTSKNTLTWQGIQVRPTVSTPLATGNITETGASTIAGMTGTTNLGTLTEVTSVPACNSTTTIANGATPSSVTIAPGAAITDLDYFTLATSNGTDTVTAVTVPLLPAGAFNNIAQVDLTDNSNVARCTAVTNPASNTISFTTCTISVNTTATQYKVRITPKTHAAMPPPPGASYATTGTVTTFTSTNAQSGSDSSSATVTIDNLSPNGATATSEIPGDMQVTLNWTTSSSVDFSRSVVLRWTGASAGTDVPAEGIDYVNGNTIGTATVACVRTTDAASSAVSGVDGAGTGGCSTSILTDGQAYTYKVFQKDSSGNYDVGVAMGTATPAATPALSKYHMDEASWNGTLNEILDSGTGGFNGTAAGLTTRPTTSNASPAIANSPGTCRYGVFNRSNKDYIALPGGFPKLTTAAGGFTIAAWINVANSALPGQRILIDDENNTLPGGWGFSVGETTTFGAGGLRFYYRETTAYTYTLDTVAIPSNQWLFVALAVQVAAGANASTATIYAWDTAGTLVTSLPGTFTWIAGSDPGSPSIGGETNASGENTYAFGFGGNIDEVRVYQKALNQNTLAAIAAQTHPCPITAPDHIRILHNGTGLTCMPETITVKACGDPACNTLYSGLVTTNLNGVIGAVTFSGGTTTASVAQTTAGSVTLGASSTSPTPATAARCFNGATETCTLTFSDAGLILANVANGTEATVPAQVAGVTSAQYVLRAVKKSTTSACTAGLTGVQTVNFGYECNDPTSCAAGNLLKVNGTAVQSNSNNPLLGYSYTGINLTFDGNGNSTTPVSFNYEDVGQVTLRMQKAVNGASLLGNSNAFVVKPHHFAVDVCIATTSGDCPVNTAATPTDGSGSILAVAGTASTQTGVAFKATVRSVSATSTVTPSFGTAGSVSGSNATETVALTHTCVAPIIATACAGGTAASSLAGTKSFARSAFSSGIMTVSDLTWDDVGVITLSATNGSFMGSGPVSGTSSAAGRFRADHFNVSINSNGAMAGACLAGGFTYTGQPMGYSTTPSLTITPMNAAASGSVTKNYQGAFQKLAASGVSITSPTADATQLGKDGLTKTAITAPMTTMTTGVLVNNGGTMIYTLNASDQFTYIRDANAMVGAYTTAVPLVVTVVTEPVIDGVSAAGTLPTLTPTGVSMRYGRARAQNAYGSEMLDLPVVFRTEYLASTSPSNVWSLNSADSCTNATLSFAQVGTTNITGNTCVLEPGNNSGKGCAAALTAAQTNRRYLETGVTGTDSNGVAGFAGNFNLWLRAPGATHAGSIDVTATVDSWLQYPWIGPTAVNPSARATFGIYKSPLIYRRENY